MTTHQVTEMNELLHELKDTADICTAYFDVRPTYLNQLPIEQSVLVDLRAVILNPRLVIRIFKLTSSVPYREKSMV